MGRPRYRKSAMSGLFIVNKPSGWSSMDVVRTVRNSAGFVKTGHAGTLDPLATGVIVCCIGKATRSVEAIMNMPKVYETTIDLSAFTNTDDGEGEREEVAVDTPPTEAAVRDVLPKFIGTIEQRPPLYSAVHVDGKRAYKLARKGEDVEIPSREVECEGIDFLSYEWPILTLRVHCGRGFYVRSLARDIGKELGTGGYLTELVRTAVGPYTIEKAADEARMKQSITQFDLLDAPPPLARKVEES